MKTEDKTAQGVIANKKNLLELLQQKLKTKLDFLADIGHYQIFTLLEYYLEHHDVQGLYNSKEEEICSICRFELYEPSKNIKYEQIVDSLKKADKDDDDVIKMDKCEGHYFHVGCLRNYINSQGAADYMRCPNCLCIYGVMKGTTAVSHSLSLY